MPTKIIIARNQKSCSRQRLLEIQPGPFNELTTEWLATQIHLFAALFLFFWIYIKSGSDLFWLPHVSEVLSFHTPESPKISIRIFLLIADPTKLLSVHIFKKRTYSKRTIISLVMSKFKQTAVIKHIRGLYVMCHWSRLWTIEQSVIYYVQLIIEYQQWPQE